MPLANGIVRAGMAGLLAYRVAHALAAALADGPAPLAPEPVAKRDDGAVESIVTLALAVKREVPERQIAYAEVYAPYDVDSQGEYMLPEDLELMAHRFMAKKLNGHIDYMHDNAPGRAMVVESFIARKGDPDFTPGAWVMGLHFPDRKMWRAVQAGDVSGLSFEAKVWKYDEVVEVPDELEMRGATLPTRGPGADGHVHEFVVKVDPRGNVLAGQTAPAPDGHWHPIRENVRTGIVGGHRHTFRMQRPIAVALASRAA